MIRGDESQLILPDRYSSGKGMSELSLPAGGRAANFVVQNDPILYGSSPGELAKVTQWLSTSEDSFVLRITGGCLGISHEKNLELQKVLLEALAPFRGIIASGATLSVSSDNPAEQRASMPEIGALLQSQRGSGKSIGVFPAAGMKRQDDGLIDLCTDFHAGKSWRITLDPRMERGIAAQEETPYVWDAEWQATLRLINHLKTADACRGGLLIGFDGGPATENEYRAWAKLSRLDPSMHVMLISGGDPERATDRLGANRAWLKEFPNVHCLPLVASAIHDACRRIGAFSPAAREISFAE